MNPRSFLVTILVVIALVAGYSVGVLSAARTSSKAEAAVAAPQQWEYHSSVNYSISEKGDAEASALGAQGWELVSVTYDASANFLRAFYKRPKR
jgi:hypothetical protein